jgi:hypothetical protein
MEHHPHATPRGQPMIDAAILQEFCDTTRPKLEIPFSNDQYTYACNGSMAIRIDKIDGYGESNEFAERIDKLFNQVISEDQLIRLETIQLPEIIFCEACKKGSPVCEECDGKGAVYWETSKNEYSARCKECDGDGANPCPVCNDKSKKDIEVEIGPAIFSAHYIATIMKLPGEKNIFIQDANKIAFFTFDGGAGAIMPRRK